MLTLFLRMSLLLAVSRVTRPDSVAASRSLGQSSADNYIYDFNTILKSYCYLPARTSFRTIRSTTAVSPAPWEWAWP